MKYEDEDHEMCGSGIDDNARKMKTDICIVTLPNGSDCVVEIQVRCCIVKIVVVLLLPRSLNLS